MSDVVNHAFPMCLFKEMILNLSMLNQKAHVRIAIERRESGSLVILDDIMTGSHLSFIHHFL